MKIFKAVVIVFSMFMVSQVSGQDAGKKIKRAKNKFKKVNTDKNDFISEKEWEDFYKDKTTKKGKSINYERTFLGYDKDDDKKITLDEMLKGFDKELAKSRMKAIKKGKKKSKNN